jgi:hypothetical protein
MIEKCLEVLFRHKLLLLLPPILIPLLVGPIALVRAPVYYETWTGIWVDRPTYLTYTDDWNRYITPAQNQSTRLAELLRTRTFVMDIAQRTALAPLVGSAHGEEAIHRFIARGLGMVPSGTNLLVLRFRAQAPQLSFQVLTATVDAFKEKAIADRVSQASLAISFYEARLQTADEELTRANEALRRYVAANPRLTAMGPDRDAPASAASLLGLPTSAVDPQLAELLRRAELEGALVERTRETLEKARFDASASLEGQELGFQIVDPARMPDRPTRERKKALIYPAAGLIVGFGISAALLVVLVAGDRSVRSETELAAMARVLGAVPRLRPKQVPRRAGPDAARRAIGFAAGATLPLLPAASGAR